MMKKYVILTVATIMTSAAFNGPVNASSQDNTNKNEASKYEERLRSCIQITNHPTPSQIPTAMKLICQTLLQKEMLRKQTEQLIKNQPKFPQPKRNFPYTGDNKEEKK